MYTVTSKLTANNSYYNWTLSSEDDNHYLNVYIDGLDNGIWISVSRSEDGFFFKSPCDESSDLELNASKSLEDTYNYVKKHFKDKGYKHYEF